MPPTLSSLEPLLAAGREFMLSRTKHGYLATAIPLGFDAGPIPAAWRADGDSVVEAVKRLLLTWDKEVGG